MRAVPPKTSKITGRDLQRRKPEEIPTDARGAESFATLETELEHARAAYAARSSAVNTLLETIQEHLKGAQESAPVALRPALALVQASLYTLLGRRRGRHHHDASRMHFQSAVELFQENQAALEQHKSRTRFLTDWGIALHRLGRTDEAIAILSRVCEGGVAPPEAFGYLGYAERMRGNLQAAEDAIRKGLAIAPADLTMNYHLARLLEDRVKQVARTGPPEQETEARIAAAEGYCRAGEIAQSVQDLWSAVRDGLKGLRMNPLHEPALFLAVDSLRQMARFRRAFTVVEQFLRRQPTHLLALGLKGVLLRDLGDLEESAKILGAISTSPDLPNLNSPALAWIWTQLAVSLSAAASGNLDEALRAAEKGASLAPDDVFANRVLGLLQAHGQDHQAAATSLAKARQLGDDSEEVALELSRVLMASENYQQAYQTLKDLIGTNPRSAGGHYLLGTCEEFFGNRERALAHYRRASRLQPDEPEYFDHIMGLLKAGESERGEVVEEGLDEEVRSRALDEIESRISGPLRYRALWYKSKIETEEGKKDAALESLEAAAQAAEERNQAELPDILVEYGNALRLADRYGEAHKAFQHAYGIDRSSENVLFAKARYHCEVAEFSEAQICLDSALALPERDRESTAFAFYLKGWCLEYLGQPQAAAGAYREAFDLSDGKDPWYRKGLGDALISFDKEQAQKHFAAIVESQKYGIDRESPADLPTGSNASTMHLLGWCNYRLGHYDEAIRLLQTALAQSPDNQTGQFDLALVLLASGRTRLADKAYLVGHSLSGKCERERQRGLYYIALFDLAELMFLQDHPAPASQKALENVKNWLEAAGGTLEGFPWPLTQVRLATQESAK